MVETHQVVELVLVAVELRPMDLTAPKALAVMVEVVLHHQLLDHLLLEAAVVVAVSMQLERLEQVGRAVGLPRL